MAHLPGLDDTTPGRRGRDVPTNTSRIHGSEVRYPCHDNRVKTDPARRTGCVVQILGSILGVSPGTWERRSFYVLPILPLTPEGVIL